MLQRSQQIKTARPADQPTVGTVNLGNDGRSLRYDGDDGTKNLYRRQLFHS